MELLRSPDWNSLNTLWICNRVNAKCCPDIFFSGDVTRSSPVLYHEYCVQDGNLVPKLSLVLLTLPLPVFTTHALLPILPEASWALEWIRVRVEGQIRFENAYVWTWKFLNPERNSCAFILYPDTFGGGLNERLNGLPSSEPLLSGIQAYGQARRRAYSSQVHRSMQSVQMILTLKRGQKGWRSYFQRHCNELFSLTTKAPCFVSCVLYYHT